ncbi:DUF1156 domain-containing protein [Planctomycetota bacterium]
MTKEHPVYSPRKLIEVALPLDEINAAAAKEKGNPFLKGHPRNLHQWWARRPQATARAVIFSQLVNDPGYQQGSGFKYGKNKKDAAKERKRLFDILEELVLWENTNKEDVLEKARAEILRSWREVCDLNKDHPDASTLFNPHKLPAFYDAFAGGGAIPLEAKRLGLEAYASDLNPVGVLINKALIEIPARFSGCAPIGPVPKKQEMKQKLMLPEHWPGSTGLAEDIRRYGVWMQREAKKRIGHLFPAVEITAEMASERPDLKSLIGQSLEVISWLWVRTVKSPNPAFAHMEVPLASTFLLANKKGNIAYVEPVIYESRYDFCVKVGEPSDIKKTKRGTKSGGSHSPFLCLMSQTPIPFEYIREEGKAGRINARLMAVVAKVPRGRVYLTPTKEIESITCQANTYWKPEVEISHWPGCTNVVVYGLTKFADLFTPRQLVSLTTLSDLVQELRDRVKHDAVANGLQDDGKPLAKGGTGPTAYAEAISILEAFCVDKLADYNNTICTWNPTNQNIGHLFTKQAIPMSWDYPEISPLTGGLTLESVSKGIAKTVESLPISGSGVAFQQDCAALSDTKDRQVISIDPPYYDNVPYADLSDFFYVWLRRSLKVVYPELFSTLAVPKLEELVAKPHSQGGKEEASSFFLNGMLRAMQCLSIRAHPSFPVSIYYAFKQSETNVESTVSIGWESFLDAVIRAGFVIVGTWPMRTERSARSRGQGSNALASSVVLVCRKRLSNAESISRRRFLRELNAALPEALDEMTRGVEGEQSPVAPVDLSQAIIGPGMAVFSKYSAVLEADGEPMTVRTALQLINRFLAEDDFDKDTQFCLHWFEQYGWNEGVFGEADVLARAKATSVDGVYEAGVVERGGGKVRLLRWSEYPTDWDPAKDLRTPVWEALHHLIRGLKQGGESDAGKLLAGVQSQAEAARQLAYRLYTLCERKGWAEDARAYNELITSWSAIVTAAPREIQRELF